MERNSIECELSMSKVEIEKRIGEKVKYFSYPYAYPQEDKSFRRLLKFYLNKFGYDAAVTTIVGRMKSASGKLEIPRIPINSGDDENLFLAKLKGAYDWMRWPQVGVRFLKALHRKCEDRR
jgi:hypothetical protein